MTVFIDSMVVALCLLFGGIAGYLLHERVLVPAMSYVIGIIAFILSITLIALVDIEMPLSNSVIRATNYPLSYPLSCAAHFLKYFLLCLIIFSFKSKRKNRDAK